MFLWKKHNEKAQKRLLFLSRTRKNFCVCDVLTLDLMKINILVVYGSKNVNAINDSI